jgi:thiosulfate reductase cytochrome b subunit
MLPATNVVELTWEGVRGRGMSRISGVSPRTRPIHPWPLRLTYWLSAVAIVVMVGSGWEVYDASPLFGFTFPQFITIGHWLGGAIAWHLVAMWLLAANGLIYVLWGLASGHFRRKFRPLSPRDILHDSVLALHLRLGHDKGEYNSVQRAMYVGVLVLGFKNPKSIVAIGVTNAYPGGYWEDQGYNWFSGS